MMELNFDDLEENLKKLPPDFRPSRRELEAAYGLFGENNGVRPDIRILLGSYCRPEYPDQSTPSLRIIIDNRLCLFFIREKNEGWIFDGYEAGNYENVWKDFDWME
jgi:hypothetical protein